MQPNWRKRLRTVLIWPVMRHGFFIALLVLMSASSSQCQTRQPDAHPPEKPEDAHSGTDSKDPEDTQRKQMIADTEKLYRLALELRAEVAKTHQETLSLAVLKKAKEVEAMARSLKTSMSHPEKPSKK